MLPSFSLLILLPIDPQEWHNIPVGRIIFLDFGLNSQKDKKLRDTMISILKGMKNVWLKFDPAGFIIPITIAFSFFFIQFVGPFSILYDYIQVSNSPVTVLTELHSWGPKVFGQIIVGQLIRFFQHFHELIKFSPIIV